MLGFIVAGAKAIGGFLSSKAAIGTIAAFTLVSGVKAYKTAKELSKSLQNQGSEILANKTSAGGKIPVFYGHT